MSGAKEIDLKRFSAEVRTSRGKLGLRAVATKIGEISAPTLSRIEQGNVPDLDTYVRLCRWMKKSPDEFLLTSQTVHQQRNVPKLIEASLRADKTLSSETIAALSRMVELAYAAAKSGKL